MKHERKPKPKAKPRRTPHVVPRLTADELRAFVLDWCDGRVTSTHEVPHNLIPNVFFPLFLGAFAEWTKRELSQIGLVYAVAGKHRSMGGYAINGYPMYAKCRYMHKDDWERARAAINAELDRRKTIEV